MNSLETSLEQYLAMRRRLGFTLHTTEKVLKHFMRYARKQGANYVTVALVQRWMLEPNRAGAATWSLRIGIVRLFARWLGSRDARTEVPPERLVPRHTRRARPHIYSDAEVRKILLGSANLASTRGLKGLRGPTFAALFGLVAVTGMRISEALALDCSDVDFEQGLLTIRRTKFGKTRLVPLHATAVAELRMYAKVRDRVIGRTPEAFFVFNTGGRVTEWSAQYNFARVSQAVGVRARVKGYKHGRGPRIHDLRHRFAVKTLLGWYRSGADPEREIEKLSTYLGHVSSRQTYWYIEAVPEILALATQRVVAAHGGRS